LRAASVRLIAMISDVDGVRWHHVPEPGVWSIGKDAEHVADAAAYHRWIVRRTIGQADSSRPPIERLQTTTWLAVAEAAELIQRSTEKGAQLLLALSDEQLDRPTVPPRARGQRLAETIERVMIGHLDAHREAIESKL
jgi:uncharacterized damage-inducible protein DinB